MTPRLFLAALCLAAAPAAAADFADPTWPCIQRKVGELSIALMWPHPIEAVELDDSTEAAVDLLVSRLTLRRIPVEETEGDISAFVAAHGGGEPLLGHVYERAFHNLAGTRHKIMSGIEEYSLSQIDLSDRIGETRAEMDAIMATDAPDFDRVDVLEETLDWDERIYDDRRRSLTYVCETPVLLEKRLYAIAQMLAAAVES